MAVFLIPFAAIAIGGALAAGAGIGVIEAKKNKAEQAAKLEEAKKVGEELGREANKYAESGALYPAFRTYRKYIDHMASNFNISPEVKQRLEDSYNALRESALKKYRDLKNDYDQKKNVALAKSDTGEELFQAQDEHLADLDKLLGPDAPMRKKIEESFGINYQAHKQGYTTN